MSEPLTTECGVWSRLQRQFALVSLRPQLIDTVRVRTIGGDHELYDLDTRRVLPIDPTDAELVRRFDGQHTIAELIVANLQDGDINVDPILSLVDRLVRAEMLAPYPPNVYRRLADHFGIAPSQAAPAAVDEQPADPDTVEPRRTPLAGPWRARSPIIAERARFLRSVALLAGLELSAIGALADGARLESWPATSTIVSEGGRADRFFIVLSGEVLVHRRGTRGDAETIARLGPGEWFGEAALIGGSRRNASVRAGDVRDAKVLSFDETLFDRYIRPHVTASASSDGLVSRRRERLRDVPLFRSLATQDLDRLARVLREHVAERGNVLFRQGEPADCFYVIEQGSVGVVKDGAPIAKLVAGEFFGETALLFTEDRTATIAATEDTRFWVLDRDAFDLFLRDALLHRRELMPTVLNRLGSSEPV